MEISPIRKNKFLKLILRVGFDVSDFTFDFKNEGNAATINVKFNTYPEYIYRWRNVLTMNRYSYFPGRTGIVDIHNYKEQDISKAEEKALKEFDVWLDCVKLNWEAEKENLSLEINKNFFIPDNMKNSKKIVKIWGDEPNYKIFISHKAEDKLIASTIKVNLKKYGLSCFVAHEDIIPTKEWQTEIEIAIETADSFVALLTKNFSQSNWTDQEVGYAYARKIPIIPIRLGKDPYGFIGKFHGLKCDIEHEYKKIISILLSKDEKMVNHFITLVEKSESYECSNDLATFLSDIENLNSEQIQRLLNVFNVNSQVSSSMGFVGHKTKNGYKYGRGLLFELKRITGNDYQVNKATTEIE